MDNGLNRGRLGMVIGKKSIKLATRRNRVKRALRESFRQHFHSSSVDLVVVARNGVSVEHKSLLNEQIASLMQKLQQKILSNHSVQST
jgi:ribonuclease P protein component